MMLLGKFNNRLDKYIFENMTFRIVSIVLLCVIVFQTYLISSRMNNQRTVFLPPMVTHQEMWVSGNEVSKSYLDDTAHFIAFNLMNVTKDSAKGNIANLLALVDSRYYYEVKAVLTKQADYITDNGISRVFYPSAVNADSKGILKIVGSTKDIISDKVVSSGLETININYSVIQGRFWITGINIVKGDTIK